MYRIFVIEDDDAINRLLCMNLSIFFLMHKELTDRLHFTEDLLTSLTVR